MNQAGVSFSEEGFKLFLDFVRDITGNQQQPQGEETQVDTIVKAYMKREDATEHTQGNNDPIYNMDEVTTALVKHISQYPETVYDNEALRNLLGSYGFEYNARAIAPVMRGVTNRTDKIIKTEEGYKYNG